MRWPRLAIVVASVGVGPAAAAQICVKPRVLLAFDTSGSMAWEACDAGAGEVDDTLECPGTDVSCGVCNAEGCGNGVADDGRLYKVKHTTTTVVEAFAPQVQFALARFHQSPAAFSCKTGGWQGAPPACVLSPLGSEYNAADILVDFSDDAIDLLEWVDFTDNVDGTADPSAGCSLCPDCANGCDKELRPSGATPLGGSLYSVREHLDASRAADPAAARPYAVVLLTDGENNCPDPSNGDNDPSPEQAAAICATGVPVHVIGFSTPGLNDVLALIAASGCGPACRDPDGDGVDNCDGQAILVDSEAGLTAAISAIVGASLIETCNGVDDDCDGETDEGACGGGPDAGADGGTGGGGCARCEPHTQGYWHRQCVGCGWIESTGRGPGEHPDFTCDELLALFTKTDPDLAPLGQTTCEALDAMPASDPCERALKQYAASLLNLASGRVSAGCELAGDVPVGDLLADVGARIGVGDCQTAAALADSFNTGARCAAPTADGGSIGATIDAVADAGTDDAPGSTPAADAAGAPDRAGGEPDIASPGLDCSCGVGVAGDPPYWLAVVSILALLVPLRRSRRRSS